MIPPIPNWRCNKQVGFLFPHRCERISPEGCPDCRNGQVNDPYHSRTDRCGYDDFDTYSSDETTGAVAGAFAFGGGDAGGGGASAEFTEADGESLVKDDDGFEDDLSAS